MATEFKITKADGSEEILRVKPKHILQVEKKFGGLSATVESSYTLAWLASGSSEKFDAWLDEVDDIEPVGEEFNADAHPTSGE